MLRCTPVLRLAAAGVLVLAGGPVGPAQPLESSSLSAGAYRSDDWVPLDDALRRWPARDYELPVLAAQARRPRLADKRMVLTRFAQLVEAEAVSPLDLESIAVLEFLALEGVVARQAPYQPVPQTSPMIRREAVELLGRIGGPHADTVMRTVMQRDRDLVVLAEAVYALGRIRTDADEELLRLLTEILAHNTRSLRDNNLAYATLLTVERLHRSSWGIDDPALFRAVFEVRSGPFIGPVRRKADEVARLLRRGS